MAPFAAIAPGRSVPAPAPCPEPVRWARPPVGQVLLSPPHLTGGEAAAAPPGGNARPAAGSGTGGQQGSGGGQPAQLSTRPIGYEPA